MKKFILLSSLLAAGTLGAWATTYTISGTTVTGDPTSPWTTSVIVGTITDSENNTYTSITTTADDTIIFSTSVSGYIGAWGNANREAKAVTDTSVSQNATLGNFVINSGVTVAFNSGGAACAPLFTGSFSGSGNLVWNNVDATNYGDYIFAGDMTKFSGNFTRANAVYTAGSELKFGENRTGHGILQFGAVAASAYASTAAVENRTIANISGSGIISTTSVLRYNYAASSNYDYLSIDNADSTDASAAGITARHIEFAGGASYIVNSNLAGSNSTAANNILNVAGGSVALAGTVSGFGSISIADGAKLTVASTGTLYLDGETTISGSVGTFATAAGATLGLSGTLTIEGTASINAGTIFDLAGSFLEDGVETTLVTGADLPISITEANLKIDGQSLSNYRGTLDTSSTTSTDIKVTFTASSYALTWNGGENGNWDFSSGNWSGSDTNFKGYDSVTFGSSATVALGINALVSGLTVAENATLSLSSTEAKSIVGMTNADSTTATMTIGKAAKVVLGNSVSLQNVTLAGTGTLDISADNSALSGITYGDSWTGTVYAGTIGAINGWTLNTIATEHTNANSYYGFTGFSGWISGDVTRNLELGSGTAINLTDGSSGSLLSFSGNIKGSGAIIMAWGTGTGFSFTGDLSAYSGNITTTQTGAKTLLFGGATAGKAANDNVSGTGIISWVGTGTNNNIHGKGVTFNYTGTDVSGATAVTVGNDSITATYLTFEGGADYAVSSDLIGTGTASVLTISAGTTTVTGSISNFGSIVATGATIVLGDDATVSLTSHALNTIIVQGGTATGFTAEKVGLTRNNAAIGMVDGNLVITAVGDNATLTWAYTNGNWNTDAANWLNNGSKEWFISGDSVIFTGTNTGNITLQEDITANVVTVEADSATTFSLNNHTLAITQLDVNAANTITGAGTLSVSTVNIAASQTLTINNATTATTKTIGNVNLAAGATLSLYQAGATGSYADYATKVSSLTLKGDAILATTYHAGVWEISNLYLDSVTSATLQLNDSHGANNTTVFAFGGDNTTTDTTKTAFAGTLEVNQTNNGTRRNVAIQINKDILGGAVIDYKTGTTSSASSPAIFALAVNTDATIAGLKNEATYTNSGTTYNFDINVFSGSIEPDQSDNSHGAEPTNAYSHATSANTLTINTANSSDSFSFSGNFTGIAIAKSGDGTQALTGTISDYVVTDDQGTETSRVKSSVAVSAGTLNLSGTNTYTGGSTVTGGYLFAASSNALGAGTTTIDGGQLKLGQDSNVTLTNVSLNIVLDSYSVGDGIASQDSSGTSILPAITGNASSSLTTTGTIELSSLDLVASSATQAQYYLVDSSMTTLLGNDGLTADSFSLTEELLNAGWSITGFDGGVITLAIPEPSMFGLLAGTLALALAGTRRRRRGNAK